MDGTPRAYQSTGELLHWLLVTMKPGAACEEWKERSHEIRNRFARGSDSDSDSDTGCRSRPFTRRERRQPSAGVRAAVEWLWAGRDGYAGGPSRYHGASRHHARLQHADSLYLARVA